MAGENIRRLEVGSATGENQTGFEHILDHHLNDFETLNVYSAKDITRMLYSYASNEVPVGIYNENGTAYSCGIDKYLIIVYGSNGYIVSAYPTTLSVDIAKMVFN